MWILKENLVAIISGLAFILSLSSWIYTFITQRKKLSIRLVEAKSKNEMTILQVLIENRSRLPISITRIQLVINEESIDCVTTPEIVLETKTSQGKEVISRRDYYSMDMPINIGSLGAVGGYLLFRGPQCMLPNDATSVILVVCANRGRPFQTTLPLPQDCP
ncbi:hypothetical protein NIF40_09110 [[Clostridium] leptum]|nr:hypothetical protein [[Clostridium] leptum]